MFQNCKKSVAKGHLLEKRKAVPLGISVKLYRPWIRHVTLSGA
ncbi:hypothetical protein [Paenibacillus sp. sptzw28]|nr:hypothetical protein [Paenibacillus sp. sptzw28]